MACSRCGSNCTCACSGDPLPSTDWRYEVAMQVRAHKARSRRRSDPNSPQLGFADPEPLETSTVALRTARRRWDESASSTMVETAPQPMIPSAPVPSSAEVEPHQEPELTEIERENALMADIARRPPLPPFPRVSAPIPKIIEFPRLQPRNYELAEPVGDQLRIFEAVEEVPPPPSSHLNQIEIAPEEPVTVSDLEVPLQTAAFGARAYAAAVDAVIMICATSLFAVCAALFANSLPMNKAMLASAAISLLMLVTIYYFLSLYFGHGTPGMGASGLRVLRFSGSAPSRAIMGWRALATVLSAAALGMGFAWSLIDEDRLCWHDRITHTYLSSK